MVALALVVVVASMAAGVVRAARERRGELAVLRALGLDRRRVAVLLGAEPLLVTLVGLVVGTAVGVTVLWALFSTGFSDLPFVLDVPQLALLLGTTAGVAFAAVVLAAGTSARRIGADDLLDLG